MPRVTATRTPVTPQTNDSNKEHQMSTIRLHETTTATPEQFRPARVPADRA
jgi:hypothetical protein